MAVSKEVQDFLDTLAEGLEDMPEDLKTMVLPEMLSATKLKAAPFEMDCPGCGRTLRKNVSVAAPDYAAWSRAVEMIWNRVYGKPKEAPPAVVVAPEVSQAQVDQMVKDALERFFAGDVTDEQLAKLASA